jgi:DNA-binding MarR family transcriptional regulator
LSRHQISDGYSDLDEIVQSIEGIHRGIVSVALAPLRDVSPQVGYAEFGVLRVLAVEGSRRISDISNELSMAPSTLTRYCDQLCRLGLMIRTRDARDRREVRIDLTSQGHALVKFVVKRQHRDLADYFSSLSTSERAGLLRIARKLVPSPDGEDDADGQASA